jgi:hypothetical protein
MALHTGATIERDGDYFGPPLNRVARLLYAAHGGQVLLSAVTQELVKDQLPADTQLRDLGEGYLKDLSRPERVFQLVVSDLPSDFPPLRTLESYPNNLPLQATPLIGRVREVEEVSERLRGPETRLLTLVGPGARGRPAWGCRPQQSSSRTSRTGSSTCQWPPSLIPTSSPRPSHERWG